MLRCLMSSQHAPQLRTTESAVYERYAHRVPHVVARPLTTRSNSARARGHRNKPNGGFIAWLIVSSPGNGKKDGFDGHTSMP